MSHRIKYRTFLITFILLFSSLSVLLITPSPVNAQEATGETTLYFSKYNYTQVTDELYQEMSMVPPTDDNSSQFPPSIKQTDEWIEWIGMWFLTKFSLGLEEFEDLDLTEEELMELYGLLGGGLLDPFSLIQIYKYDGAKDLKISGNVKFELYFTSTLISKLNYQDEIEVGVYHDSDELEKIKVKIEPEFLKGKIQKHPVFLEDLDFTLERGDQLKFLIKLIPSEKPIGSIVESGDLDSIIEFTDLIGEALANQSIIPELQDLGLALLDFVNLTEAEEFNFTMADLAELLNTVRSSALVYGSADYPSSVTLPVQLSDDDNVRAYYLREEGQLSESRSIKEESTTNDLRETRSWTGPGLERNKKIMDATASLYLENRNLRRLLNMGNTNVIATISYGDQEIASSTKELGKTTILDSILNPIEPTIFEFSFDPIEIEYGEKIRLEVGVENETRFGPFNLGIYRNVNILYDSDKQPSHLTVIYNETDNIDLEITNDISQKIVATGSAFYDFIITSKYEDEITLSPLIIDNEGEWDIDYQEKFDLSKDETVQTRVYLNHTEADLDAYGDEDEEAHFAVIKFEAAGKTGLDSETADAVVSEDKVEFDVVFDLPSGQEIKHGKTATYDITITNNNTGLWPDSYTITIISENDWSIEEKFLYEDLENVDAGDSFNITLKLKVPKYADKSSDKLTIIITSGESNIDFSANITTDVITPNPLESIYKIFEDASKSMGLDDSLGKYGTWLLIAIVFIILLFFLAMIIFILRIKNVKLICTDRVKEINSDQKVVYSITVENPSKNPQIYDLSINKNIKDERWNVSLNTDKISVEPKQSEVIYLSVKPTDMVKSNDWVEAVVVAKVVGKSKSSELATVTTLKQAKPDLKIIGALTWPKDFKGGERVETSFKIENKGKVAADNLTVVLYVNGEEKNKVEDITIPRGGYAEIDIPWIAVKGKNEINIVVS
jgi:hypothetical protein